jgi:serine/threonine protein kinase
VIPIRDCLTPAYAAPEQWRGERPSTATDVYALGCIIHALFLGHPPFVGSIDDIRENHLHTAPPPISVLPPRISAFVSHMLRKPPNARPTLDRCAQVLSDIKSVHDKEIGSHPQLDEAAKQVAEIEAKEEAKLLAAETVRCERDELFADARNELLAIRGRFFKRLTDSSESVKIDHRGSLSFGSALVEVSEPERLEDFIAARHAGGRKSYRNTGWDVLGWAMISVTCVKGLGNPYLFEAHRSGWNIMRDSQHLPSPVISCGIPWPPSS